MNMEAGIERLRASKISNVDRTRAEGHRLGKEWALNRAEHDNLERVAAMRESIGGQWDAPGAAYHLAQAIDENEMESDTLEHVFINMHQDELTDDLIEGFIEGAAEVFYEV